MIKHIMSNTHLMRVNMTSPPYISNNGQSAGQVRWNTNSQNMEVYDGSVWLTMSQSVSLDLSPQILEVLDWAQRKQAEEQAMEKLIKQHPALKDLHDKLEMMKILVKESEHASQ
jgi:hypothetical protein